MLVPQGSFVNTHFQLHCYKELVSSSAFEFLMVLFLLWHAGGIFYYMEKLMYIWRADVLKTLCTLPLSIIIRAKWRVFLSIGREMENKFSPEAGERALISCWFPQFFIQVASQHWYQSLLVLSERTAAEIGKLLCYSGNKKVFMCGDSSKFVNCLEILGNFVVYALISLQHDLICWNKVDNKLASS